MNGPAFDAASLVLANLAEAGTTIVTPESLVAEGDRVADTQQLSEGDRRELRQLLLQQWLKASVAEEKQNRRRHQ